MNPAVVMSTKEHTVGDIALALRRPYVG